MRVIEINATYGQGSTGLIVRDIGHLLENNGYSAYYAYQVGKCETSNSFLMGTPWDWTCHALYARLTGREAYASWKATENLLKWMNEIKPDIVHLHNLHANYINLPMLLLYLAENNIATVVTLHDCWFFTGKCCHFTSVNCERWKNCCGKCPKRWDSPMSIFRDSSSEVLKERIMLFQGLKRLTVVGCSQWIANLAQKSPVFRGKQILVIRNGVDTKIFIPKSKELCRQIHNIHAGFVVMGMADKWLNIRNYDILKMTLEQLPQDGILLLLGCKDEQRKKLPKDLRLVPISFVQDRNALAEYYNCADVFVNLTFEDTLPTVNMEAICCGIPVITYDSCGSPELVQDGISGYVVPQRDKEALWKAIKSVKAGMISRDTCHSIGMKAFDKHDRYQDYVNLFRELCISN